MREFKEGDNSNGICEDCQSIVTTTFKMRNVPFSDHSGSVEVLAGVCNKCGYVVSIPASETVKIKEALMKEKS